MSHRDNSPGNGDNTATVAATLHPNEKVKAASRGLRGTLAQGLVAPLTSGFPSAADQQLLRLHGMYQQDDRDLRHERRRQKLEPAYQLMMRVRLPGGVCQSAQWLQLADIARTYGGGSLRLTSRQTFQFHGLLKRNVKATVQRLSQAMLDTIAACGDVNRTVVCSPNPHASAVHARLYALAKAVSEHLLPKSQAYFEIFLDREPVAGGSDEETIYGKAYLPRKFKIGFVAPPHNDVDIYAQDLGFVAIVDGTELVGFNVLVGGGMGRTDNEPTTYARLASTLGFCTPDQVIDIAEAVVKIQRDYGDRVERQHARFKYTIDQHGLPWLERELAQRLGFTLGPARAVTFESNNDRFGWTRSANGLWHYGLFIENGRIIDRPERPLFTGLAELARVHGGELRLTCNQNLIVCNVPAARRARIDEIIARYGLDQGGSVLRRHAMACVAFPTCGLAMAESERYLPSLVTKIEAVTAACGLAETPIVIRMSGCANGCSRPYLAEIAFTGRALGRYNVFLGGSFAGARLAQLYLENVEEERILSELSVLLRRYAAERQSGEHFGDFTRRAGIVKADAGAAARPSSGIAAAAEDTASVVARTLNQ